MNTYESFAHALIQEHGRSLLQRNHYVGNPYGYSVKFWKNVMFSYGGKLYTLPRTMGLNEPKDGFAFPAFTMKGCIELGIALPELMLFKTVGEYSHLYTPIHLGTALIIFGNSRFADEADRLLQVDFMKKLYPKRSVQDFATQSFVNPYTPEYVKRKPYSLTLLRADPDDFASPEMVLDELGNAAWFPLEYVKNNLKTVDPELWLHTARKLAHIPSLAQLKNEAAYKLLVRDGAANGRRHNTYRKVADHARAVTLEQFTRYIAQVKGVQKVAGCFRADVDAETMNTGLRVLAQSNSASLDKSYELIGRPLTYEDVEGIKSTNLLTLLRNCHFDTIRSLIASDSERLSAMLFNIPPSLLRAASDCMTENLPQRPKKWYPDTEAGNYELTNHTAPSTPDALDPYHEWRSKMQPLISLYLERRDWRDELLEITEPDVLFLVLTLETASEGDPVPRQAIMNVLRSHPNIGPIIEMVKEKTGQGPVFTSSL